MRNWSIRSKGIDQGEVQVVDDSLGPSVVEIPLRVRAGAGDVETPMQGLEHVGVGR